MCIALLIGFSVIPLLKSVRTTHAISAGSLDKCQLSRIFALKFDAFKTLLGIDDDVVSSIIFVFTFIQSNIHTHIQSASVLLLETPESSRQSLLSALSKVGRVKLFSEWNNCRIIEKIKWFLSKNNNNNNINIIIQVREIEGVVGYRDPHVWNQTQEVRQRRNNPLIM